MSATDDSTKDFRDSVSFDARNTLGAIRRMAVKLTAAAIWRVIGHTLLSGDRETRDADVFGTAGFFSRPRPNANAEAVVVFVGGSSNPCIVATRDEDTRKAVAQLDQDETAMYNSSSIATAKADGTFEIKGVGGTAVRLATFDDVKNLRDYVLSHTHPAPGGTTSPPTGPVPSPQGTSVLRGQ